MEEVNKVLRTQKKKKVAHWLKLLMRHAHLPGTEPTGIEPSVAPRAPSVTARLWPGC